MSDEAHLVVCPMCKHPHGMVVRVSDYRYEAHPLWEIRYYRPTAHPSQFDAQCPLCLGKCSVPEHWAFAFCLMFPRYANNAPTWDLPTPKDVEYIRST